MVIIERIAAAPNARQRQPFHFALLPCSATQPPFLKRTPG
jgi:hypothetical protein